MTFVLDIVLLLHSVCGIWSPILVWKVCFTIKTTNENDSHSSSVLHPVVGPSVAVHLEELPSSNQHRARMSHFLMFAPLYGRRGLSFLLTLGKWWTGDPDGFSRQRNTNTFISGE